MGKGAGVIVGVAVILAASGATACGVHESEEKTRQVIAAMIDMRERDDAKARAAERGFDTAMAQLRDMPGSRREEEMKWQLFCKAMDKLLADLQQ